MIYSPERNAIIYAPEHAAAIAQYAPWHAMLGSYPVVRADMPTVQVLRLIGLPVPSLMEMTYDWPRRRGIEPMAHQRLTAAFMAAHPRSFNLSEMGCVDGDTEYLSPEGWRRIAEFNGGQVAQWHPDGRAEFVTPTGFIKKVCSEMLRFKTARGIDQKLSPEHRVLWVDWRGGLQVSSALDIAIRDAGMPRGWGGRFITTFAGPGGPGVDLSEPELRLQVAIIADGHFPNKTKRCVIRIKKERKKHRLRWLLEACGIEYKETMPEYASAKGFSLFKFIAPRRDKVFDTYYWQCSRDQTAIIADEVVNWDGSEKKAGGSGFYSTEKQSADFVQYCYTSNGRTASISCDTREGDKPLWRVHAREGADLLYLKGASSEGVRTWPITVEPTTDGFKYCFTVPTSFLVYRRNGCIFVSGNTGKTLAALWAADYLMRVGLLHRVLVLAPLSILRRAWADEIFRHFMGRRSCVIVHGDRKTRLDAIQQRHDYYIINHDGLGVGTRRGRKLVLDGIAKIVHDREDIDCAIVDEGSAYKDHHAWRTRILRATLHNKPYIWWMSGTPVPNAPTDAWAQARIVRPDFAEPFDAYRERTMIKVGSFKWAAKAGAKQAAFEILTPAIRFSRDECLDLPDCLVPPPLEIPLSAEQKKAYDTLRKDLSIQVASGERISAVNEGVLRMKLIQIACGEIYDAHHRAHHLDCAPRLDALTEICREASAKILVFAPLTSVVEMVYRHLSKEFSVERVTGSVSAKQRGEIFQAFEAEEAPRVIVADPGTMAHGITLVRANTIVWYGPTDRPEIYQQANARINRPGQTRKMLVARLASTPVEKEIFRRLQEKISLQGAILKMVEAVR